MMLPLPSHFGHLRLASGSCRVRLPQRIQEFPAKFISALSRPFTFHVGVSWASKPEDPKITRFHTPFPADSCVGRWRDTMLALREKNISRDAGEDFFYITQGVAFGVADGVGGWIDSGVDPSLFAQSLMYHAHRYSRDAWAGEPEIDPTQEQPERAREDGRELTPHQCLDLAYHGVLQDRLVEAGMLTTFLVLIHAPSTYLQDLVPPVFLGDSGFLIIRSSSVIHKQPTQTHFFNCPLQLTKLPLSTNTNMHYIDLPDAAAEYEAKLRDGDIVVAYTDGLSDNVFPADIVAICSLVARSAMADAIVRYAQTCMRDRKRVSPFEREASREGMLFRGGKIDE
ncbi:phosphatase 2C-like domain-containing protein [Pisolithus sp. B1]|nr:phosphatase 2C-like domain-containing protein [Pisolithus sp. B1]